MRSIEMSADENVQFLLIFIPTKNPISKVNSLLNELFNFNLITFCV